MELQSRNLNGKCGDRNLVRRGKRTFQKEVEEFEDQQKVLSQVHSGGQPSTQIGEGLFTSISEEEKPECPEP